MMKHNDINQVLSKELNKDSNQKKTGIKQRLYVSIVLTLIALVAITAATVAWFSIADNTKVNTMALDIVTDVEMRMDLDPHSTIDQYVRTLSFEAIANRIQSEKGFSVANTPLEPVTTNDCMIFRYEDGSIVKSDSGAYLEFTLHFMAAKDMIVHLTSANSSDDVSDGTSIGSNVPSLSQSMRISFTADGQTYIYDPGLGDTRSVSGTFATFGLPPESQMELSDNNAMFTLKEGVNKPVKVHIWIEGTDPECTDEIKKAEYSIKLRFSGTDMEGKPFS